MDSTKKWKIFEKKFHEIPKIKKRQWYEYVLNTVNLFILEPTEKRLGKRSDPVYCWLMMTLIMDTRAVLELCKRCGRGGSWGAMLEGLGGREILGAPREPIFNSSSTVYIALTLYLGFPGGSDSKESAWNVGDMGLIPGLGRSPEERNANPLQCSCLENSMDRGAWWTTVHEVTKSGTLLSD